MMTFIARMKVVEGKEAEFVRLAKALTEKVRGNEPDTLTYEFYRLREPRAFAVIEAFTSEAAETAHQNTEYFKELAPDILGCLDGTYVREYLDPLE